MVNEYAGSRMHVLDWVEGRSGGFVESLNAMLTLTGASVSPEALWRPVGYSNPAEALLDRDCAPLLPAQVSRCLREWWLAVDHPTASGPNWDLVAAVDFPERRRGLVLVEAKAHVGELANEGAAKRLRSDASANSHKNHERIGRAVAEACQALRASDARIGISRDRCYQFSNRVAFAWKLASLGIPTALIYLGFTGDAVIGRLSAQIRDAEHWRSLIKQQTDDVFPTEMWEREIAVVSTPLWLLARTLPAYRHSPELAVRRASRGGQAS
ncbi:hypothetical protein Rmf_39760 [Roseomonas fluvialis]|uniref:Uncharacterized protein n=2 Tax=Roseomonas fluvialis TaxID=1750527 RepID=A0ABM7Y7Q1_9PROT|nr:hypothetical protein Rmf_39760 [Roseomonas fluvialis]